jgi:phospholipase C
MRIEDAVPVISWIAKRTQMIEEVLASRGKTVSVSLVGSRNAQRSLTGLMRPELVALAACLVLQLAARPVGADTHRFAHVVIVVQENRTPDNLFQGLCVPPFGSAASCGTARPASQYDIKTSNWLDKASLTGVTQPRPIALKNDYDPGHGHHPFLFSCDKKRNGICAMDGAAREDRTCSGRCGSKVAYKFVDNSKEILNPYLDLATQYGWANYMFQTNQGPSFPAHQYLFGATSAPDAGDDAMGIFAAENGLGLTAGCETPAGATVLLVTPPGNENTAVYPCFEHQTLADILPNGTTWKYYTSSGGGGIWTGPNAIAHICGQVNGRCAGVEWTRNVDVHPENVLTDIAGCKLRSLSWVIPRGQNSDHPIHNDGGGPSWAASIVNAIGNSTSCDNGAGYWHDTAIIVTWDDWGGWYDHVPPPILNTIQGDYERGFRVPLIVVSAYTPHVISNESFDFGAIARFIEQDFGVAQGALKFSDNRTTSNLTNFFPLAAPRPFVTIRAPIPAAFFIQDKRPALPPDDD